MTATPNNEAVGRYRKKPVVIEAMQLAGSNGDAHAVYQWIERNTLGSFEPMARIEGREPWPASGVSIDPRDGRLIIATLEGAHWADMGDWIIRGVQGEFYPCKPDIFAATYEPAGAAATPPPADAEKREAVAFRYSREVKRGKIAWSVWLGMDEHFHYDKDGSLVEGPHPDWEQVEYAYTTPPASVPVAELVALAERWEKGASLCGTHEYSEGARDALNECADELTALAQKGDARGQG